MRAGRRSSSRRSLEPIDSLFKRPWYTVWKVTYPNADDPKSSAAISVKDEKLEGGPTGEQVEQR